MVLFLSGVAVGVAVTLAITTVFRRIEVDPKTGLVWLDAFGNPVLVGKLKILESKDKSALD